MGFFISDAGANQFSGTFLRHEGRSFVVTAAHCLDDVKDPSSLLVTTYRRQRQAVSLATAKPGRFVESGTETHHPLVDVGVLELPDELARELDVDWFDESDSGSAPAAPGGLIAVAGFPSELVHVLGSGPYFVRPTPVVGITGVAELSPEDLPPLSPDYDPDAEFLVEYDTSLPNQPPQTKKLDPRGMSGCAILAVPPLVDDAVWSAKVVLSGIQSGWLPNLRPPLIRAKRIEWVIHLLEHSDR